MARFKMAVMAVLLGFELLIVPSGAYVRAAPANDDFDNRAVIEAAPLSAAQSNSGATLEASEPAHADIEFARASLWWTWTPTANGTATFHTRGSEVDTILAVYKGEILGTLTPVAGNDDTDDLTSRVSFRAEAGTAYQIAVSSYFAAPGTVRLALDFKPLLMASLTPLGGWLPEPRGFPWFVHISGDQAIATTSGISLFDLRSGTLNRTGFVRTRGDGRVNDMKVADGRICLVRDGYIYLFDVSRAGQVEQLARVSGDHPYMYAAACGSLLFGLTWEGLDILDLTEPDDPKLIGRLDSARAPSGPFSAACSPGLALVGLTGEVQLIDVSNPRQPRDISRLPVNASTMLVRGSLLYTVGTSGFSIHDIGNPSEPIELAQISVLGAMQLAVGGTHAFLTAEWNDGVWVMDVSDPAIPRLIRKIEVGRQAHSVAVEGNRLMVGWRDHQYELFDISDVTNPRSLDRFDVSGVSLDVEVRSNTAYIADGAAGVQILDVTDYGSIQHLGRYPTTNIVWDVALDGRILYAAAGAGGVQILDVSNAREPARIGVIDDIADARGVAVTNGVVYVAAYRQGVRAYGTQDLKLIRQFRDAAGDYLEISGNELSALGQAGALAYVFDISTPGNLRVLRSTGSFPLATAVTANGSDFFVGNSQGRLFTFNQLPRTLSRPVSTNVIGDWIVRMNFHGEHLFVSDLQAVSIVNVDDLLNPLVIARTPEGGTPRDTQIVGDILYVANGSSGLSTFRLRYGLPQTISHSISSSVPAGSAFLPLAAAASSGLPVAFAVADGPARIVDGQLIPSGPGTVTLRLEQAGDDQYLPVSVETQIVIPSGTSPRPVLRISGLNPNGRLELEVQAEPGIGVRVESSSNLRDWIFFNRGTGTRTITLPVGGNTAEFFRAVTE